MIAPELRWAREWCWKGQQLVKYFKFNFLVCPAFPISKKQTLMTSVCLCSNYCIYSPLLSAQLLNRQGHQLAGAVFCLGVYCNPYVFECMGTGEYCCSDLELREVTLMMLI